MGTIEEVGKLCLFIAAEATFTTGVDHIISGGADGAQFLARIKELLEQPLSLAL